MAGALYLAGDAHPSRTLHISYSSMLLRIFMSYDIRFRYLAPLLYVGAIIESDARPIGVQLKKAACLSTMIGLKTKQANCCITVKLKLIRLQRVMIFLN